MAKLILDESEVMIDVVEPRAMNVAKNNHHLALPMSSSTERVRHFSGDRARHRSADSNAAAAVEDLIAQT